MSLQPVSANRDVLNFKPQIQDFFKTSVANQKIKESPFINNLANKDLTQVSQVTANPASLNSVIENISKLSDAADKARQADKANTVGLIAGASNFGQGVQEIYNFLSLIGPSISGPDSGKQLLEIAAIYTKAKGGELLSTASVDTSTGQSANTAAATEVLKIDNILGQSGSKILAAAGAAYSVYDIFQGKLDPVTGAVQGMATGAYIGSMFGGVGAIPGAVIGGIAGAVSGLFKKSGKPTEQKERDIIRKNLQQAGILDSDWNIQLANFAKFDMGKDGGAKLLNLDGTQRRFKEFDLSNPLTQPAAELLMPLAQQIAGGHPRLTQEFTAYLTNAANSNAASIEDSLNNIQVLYAQFGLSFEEVYKKVFLQKTTK